MLHTDHSYILVYLIFVNTGSFPGNSVIILAYLMKNTYSSCRHKFKNEGLANSCTQSNELVHLNNILTWSIKKASAKQGKNP